MRFLALIAPIVLAAAAPVAAQQWVPVPAQSSISFSPEWNGAKVDGRFPRFSANIRFDPAKLAEARVDATIDLAAATTPDKTVNGSLPGSDWFDVKKSPTARVQLTSFTAAGKPGAYVGKGTLTMRGLTLPITLPFTLVINGNTATMAGGTVLDRRAFKIGMDSDPGATWVGFKVPVAVKIVAIKGG